MAKNSDEISSANPIIITSKKKLKGETMKKVIILIVAAVMLAACSYVVLAQSSAACISQAVTWVQEWSVIYNELHASDNSEVYMYGGL